MPVHVLLQNLYSSKEAVISHGVSQRESRSARVGLFELFSSSRFRTSI